MNEIKEMYEQFEQDEIKPPPPVLKLIPPVEPQEIIPFE